ncbi:MAG: hypothetical protein M3547_12765, partial [Acidobacteriota bacterium]|nr:hypothetical protein [Acidobacteriota bacterium]
MRGHRLVVLAASAALLATFLLSEPPRQLARRAAFLAATASKPLADRQIAGSGAAFDRRFFAFLEAARRALPVGVEGVALETSRGAQDELERGIPDRLFQWSALSFSHPEYPLGLPFLYAG